MSLIDNISRLRVSAAISPKDTMFEPGHSQHYFYVGRSNLLAIYNLINIRLSYAGGASPVTDILDVGCGHGRVIRWVRAAFPQVNYYVTDHDKVGVDWCVRNFGCIDTGGEIPAGRFDLVWLSSVFTHLPQHVAEPLLKTLLASLKPGGVLGFTSQGRYSIERMKQFDWHNDTTPWFHYNLDRARFEHVARSYEESGYGYVDYPDQPDYGVCIARPEWYAQRAFASSEFTQILFQEKGVDNHQDINGFMRVSIFEESKGALG